MEILLDNPLAAMYGPYFLIFYGFVIVSALVILKLAKNSADQSHKLPLPSIPPNIDPYEVAYLRGGTNEVARSVIFALMQKGYFEIDDSGSTTYLQRGKNFPNTANLNQLEQIAFNWLTGPEEIQRVFQANGLVTQLESHGHGYQTRLERQQLLVGDSAKRNFRIWTWTAAALVLGLGAYKIFAAILHGRFNFIGIIVMGIVGLILIGVASSLPRLSRLGKMYLERLQLTFDNLKEQAKQSYMVSDATKTAPAATFSGVDPLLLSVGVFGAGILAGTVYNNYNEAFSRAQHNAATSSGACGSSCGSDCSSSSFDSGSSCSSGSSCGGGCGGCGGGGD